MRRLLLIGAACLGLISQAAAARTYVPVLFVHGTGMTSGTWTEMRDGLRANGYPDDYLLAVDLLPRDGDNVRAARRYLEPAVEALLKAAAARDGARAARKVDIVAHSMGAVSARWYAATMRPETVRTLITLAGANHGSDVLCGYPGAGERQLCPAFATRSVQARLNGTPDAPLDETPFGVGDDPAGVTPVPADAARRILYVTLRIEPDEWIKPAHSALLAGAGGLDVPFGHAMLGETSSGNWRYVGDADHDLLPRDGAVIAWVATLLAR